MSGLGKLLRSSRSYVVLAAGLSILIIASVSKWVIKKPIDPLLLAVPPLIEAGYEYVVKKYKNSRITTTGYWAAAILISTVLILLISSLI